MAWQYLMGIQYSKNHQYIAIAIRYWTIARVLPATLQTTESPKTVMPEKLRDRKGGSIPSSQRFAGLWPAKLPDRAVAEASVDNENSEGPGLANAEAGNILRYWGGRDRQGSSCGRKRSGRLRPTTTNSVQLNLCSHWERRRTHDGRLLRDYRQLSNKTPMVETNFGRADRESQKITRKK